MKQFELGDILLPHSFGHCGFRRILSICLGTQRKSYPLSRLAKWGMYMKYAHRLPLHGELSPNPRRPDLITSIP